MMLLNLQEHFFYTSPKLTKHRQNIKDAIGQQPDAEAPGRFHHSELFKGNFCHRGHLSVAPVA
jgi:hypothetical protein